jgi:hypothetical protein
VLEIARLESQLQPLDLRAEPLEARSTSDRRR